MMSSTPSRAWTAWGRSKPWVSEMTPMRCSVMKAQQGRGGPGMAPRPGEKLQPAYAPPGRGRLILLVNQPDQATQALQAHAVLGVHLGHLHQVRPGVADPQPFPPVVCATSVRDRPETWPSWFPHRNRRRTQASDFSSSANYREMHGNCGHHTKPVAKFKCLDCIRRKTRHTGGGRGRRERGKARKQGRGRVSCLSSTKERPKDSYLSF